jgi:plastocyanin
VKLSYVLLAVIAMGCGGGGDSGMPTGTTTGTGTGTGTASGTAAVSMKSTEDGYGYATFSFAPANVTITKGGTVTWTNEGGTVAHNVTFSTAGSPSNVANFTSGTSTRTFDNVGTYSYQCTNHAGMTGTVTVQ